MKKVLILLVVLVVAAVLVLFVAGRDREEAPVPGTVLDEAMAAGRTPESFPSSDDDYLRDMDYGITQDPEAVRAALDPYVPGIGAADAVRAVVRGRNNWNIWSAGNDRLWDELSRRSFGNLDLLKTLSNHPTMSYSRDNRWQFLGLVNEPCFKKATGPRADRFGLWLDERIVSPECPPDPFEDEAKYPGVATGARGKNIPVGSYYGYASGIVGLRLFPNPAFDEAAQKKWERDPELYYTDSGYYNDSTLIKPYRVGMACGFCHVGPNPSRPPADFENPAWANLNSNPGAQYFWIDRIFQWNPDEGSFVYQLFHTSKPGALDTSLVSSDQINNPRTMNAVYNLGARIEIARKWGKEKLSGGELDNKQLNDYVPPGTPLTRYYEAPETVWTPRVLKDGADSVGALGALNRVYLNIGLFSEEWLLHFEPMVGGADITPIPIATAEKNSAYWKANEAQTPDLALFFLASARPDWLADAPGGPAYLTADEAQLTRGKRVFAERCARCHSSKLPEKAFTDFFPDEGCVNSNYLKCWDDYWQWTKTAEFKSAMESIVLAEDFLADNFLSTELRVPVTLLETNACSPLATNALAGDIWNDFSSTSYKNLPAVGTIIVHDPFTGEPSEYEMPGGGRGYTRPASLVSVWSTAPFLLSNELGTFDWRGTVEGRMASFDDSVTQLLWPDKRSGEQLYVTRSGKKQPGAVHRTTATSFLTIPTGFLPEFLRPLSGFLARCLPKLFDEGGVRIGPIPKGTPVNLLANVDLKKLKEADRDTSKSRVKRILGDLKALPVNASDEEARKVFANLVPGLLELSKCPDFVVNRGHYFGTDFLPEAEGEPGLIDEDKRALIEFLKTL